MRVACTVLSSVRMKWLSLALLAACGGHHAKRPTVDEPRLVPGVTAHWYRSSVQCAQGPFEIELPVGHPAVQQSRVAFRPRRYKVFPAQAA